MRLNRKNGKYKLLNGARKDEGTGREKRRMTLGF
jgi:hypothetical protein